MYTPKNLYWEDETDTENTRDQFFCKLAERFAPFSYQNGNLCIRIAKNRQELVAESKALNHCVAAYSEIHCNGRSIFFVRKADAPDTPLYTLQVNLKNKQRVCLQGLPAVNGIPKEVDAFIDDWLQNVLHRYDIKRDIFLEPIK
ncbi:MAG: PcfJ domain-containing protein [Oscillospiraceae bacterium]|nr:PcfJ domain-containing protein [Oscillospiraceae bacterium]